MMNVETVLSSTSESDVGGSDLKRYSLNPPSYRESHASRRMSQDPPGDVQIQLTPMEAAISELVPQDVAVRSINDGDSPDDESSQSTLTGPPTINFLNQPTDDDWEREHPDLYAGVAQSPGSRRSRNASMRSNQSDSNRRRRSQEPPASTTSSSPPRSHPSRSRPRDYASDESSSLPEIPTKGSEDEDDLHDSYLADFINRTYDPTFHDSFDSLLNSEHVIQEGDEEDETESTEGESFLQQSAIVNPDTPKKQSIRKSMTEGLPRSSLDKQKLKKESMKQMLSRRSKKDDDDVDSDLTPVMKSPHNSKTFASAAKKDPRSSKGSSLHSPPFESPVATKKGKSTKEERTPSTSKRSTTNRSDKKSIPQSPKTPSTSSNKSPKRGGHSPKVNRNNVPVNDSDDSQQAVYHAKKKKKKKGSKQAANESSPKVTSPTSVLDNPNNDKSGRTTPSSTMPKTKRGAPNQKTDPDLFSDSDSSSYQYYGKPRGNNNNSGRNQKERSRLFGFEDDDSAYASPAYGAGRRHPTDRNALLDLIEDDSESDSGALMYGRGGNKPQDNRKALLGLDDDDSDLSFGNDGRPSRTFGSRKDEDEAAGNDSYRRKNSKDRKASLGLDDDDSELSSFGKGRPIRTFGSRDEEDRHSQLLGYDDNEHDIDDVSGSSLGLGDPRNHAMDRGAGAGQQAPKSFGQIPIHPDMTPEEWQMAQEQIQFLEQELDNVATLCQELTEAAEQAKNAEQAPPDGNWTKAQQQVNYLEQELETVQELCNLLTATAQESTDAIEELEAERERLEQLIARLQRALAKSKDRMGRQEKALDDLVHENRSKCCNFCWDWISEPVVWFVSYLYRID